MHISEDHLGGGSDEKPKDFRAQLKLKQEVEYLKECVYQIFLLRPLEDLLRVYYDRTASAVLRNKIQAELKRRLDAGEISAEDCPLL